MKGISRTRAVGGSLIVTIPSEIVRAERLGENQEIEIEVRRKRKDFSEAMKSIGKFTSEDRMEDRE